MRLLNFFSPGYPGATVQRFFSQAAAARPIQAQPLWAQLDLDYIHSLERQLEFANLKLSSKRRLRPKFANRGAVPFNLRGPTFKFEVSRSTPTRSPRLGTSSSLVSGASEPEGALGPISGCYSPTMPLWHSGTSSDNNRII
jgi:hypothetical protein